MSLVATLEELGNPFLEESTDLIALDTKEMASTSSVQTVQNAKIIGHKQFNEFKKRRLILETKPPDDVISRDKFTLFVKKSTTQYQNKHHIASLKGDLELFSCMYIACQTRD